MSYAVAWFLVMSGIVAYFAPALVALCRDAPNRASIIVINVFAGWTLIGWVAALALAVRSKQESGPQRFESVVPPVQQYYN
jgi:uncharacterized membrane protein HdeD (DUF308 family)